jgi:hypothetical protein
MAAKEAGYDGSLPSASRGTQIRCVDLVSGIDLFRSGEGLRDHQSRQCQVRSRAFEQFLRLQTFETAGELLSAEDLKAVVETIDAQCQRDGKRSPVHLRVARHGDKGYLFLGDDDDTVIEFDASGFNECTQPPVKFRSASGAKPLPMPVAGKIEDLRRLFNLDDDNWVLLVAWIVMTLVHPGRPAPICVLNGEHGSAKTSALKQVIGLLDPKVSWLPKLGDLIASAYSSPLSFDNVSSRRLSDAYAGWPLVAASQAAAFTDNSLAAYDIIRPCSCLASIYCLQLDIVERHSHRADSARIYLTDQEVGGSALCLVWSIVGVCRQRDGRLPAQVRPLRMADFARVGEAVAQLMGQEPGGSARLTRNVGTAAAENSEGDPVSPSSRATYHVLALLASIGSESN